MKVGIITFNSAHNYGAVLQAWSLQEYLLASGHEAEVINYRIPAIDNVYRLFEPEKPYKSDKENVKHQEKQYRMVKKEEPKKVLAFERFEQFIAEQLRTTKAYMSYEELKEEKFDYDALITGSDQVWNTGFTRGVNPGYLLDFGPEQARRISYAVSRGDSVLTNPEKITFERKLAKFDFISVREENVAEEISKLTEHEVEVTADPTFLLEREQFDSIRRSYPCKKPYIYVHNVHVKRTDETLCAVADELSIKTGLPVATNRRDSYEYKNYLADISDIGPREFLDVIANAEYVVTNSFHATVFSMIYHKTFITIPSLRNPERMKKLLERLEISDHLMDNPSMLPENLQALRIDYEKLERLKAEYTKKSKAFLTKALDSEYVRNYPKTYEKSFLVSSNPVACYACGACAGEEDSTAELVEDQEGFLYPQRRETQSDRVEKCLLRKRQFEDFVNIPCYLARIGIEDMAKNGFYGSEVQPFCEKILEQGGVVVAKVMDGVDAGYRLLRSREELKLLYAGCLLEVKVNGAVACCKEALQTGKTVLFVGSVCEISALRMQFDDKALMTLAVGCNGVTSEKIFRKYVKELEKQYGAEVREVSFANRIHGLYQPYSFVRYDNDEVELQPLSQDVFHRTFKAGRLNRPSCYRCIYAEKWSRAVDIAVVLTGGEKKSDQADSVSVLVALGSEAGQKLLESTGLVAEVTHQEINTLLVRQRAMPAVRQQIMEQIDTAESIVELMRQK